MGRGAMHSSSLADGKSHSVSARNASAIALLIAAGFSLILTQPVQAEGNYQVINGSSSMQSLSVGSGSTGVLDISHDGVFTLPGNLSNAGVIYVVSTNPSVRTATISATNIFNANGAVITSVLPSQGLSGISNAVSGLSLNLQALNTITNHGSIVAAGSLNLQAQSIINTGSLIAQLGALNASMASLTNSGLIQAMQGSVLMRNPWGGSLSVNNTMGTIMASDSILVETMGSVTESNEQTVAQALMEVTGGTLQAQQINFQCRGGNVKVNVDQMLGNVSVISNSAKVVTSQSSLNVESADVTGSLDLASTRDSVHVADNGSLQVQKGNLSLTAGTDVVLGSGSQIAALGGGITLSALGRVALGSSNEIVSTGNMGYRAGDIVISAQDSVKSDGHNSVSSMGGSVYVNALRGDIQTGKSDTFDAFHDADFGGRVTMISANGSVRLGESTRISSLEGNTEISAPTQSVSVGSNSNISAFRGNISISALKSLTIQPATTMAAVKNGAGGGNFTLTAAAGNINIGDDSFLLAIGGSGVLQASGGTIKTGDRVGISAASLTGVDGNLSLTSMSADFGADNNLCAQGATQIRATNGGISLGANTSIAGLGAVLVQATHGTISLAENSTIATPGWITVHDMGHYLTNIQVVIGQTATIDDLSTPTAITSGMVANTEPADIAAVDANTDINTLITTTTSPLVNPFSINAAPLLDQTLSTPSKNSQTYNSDASAKSGDADTSATEAESPYRPVAFAVRATQNVKWSVANSLIEKANHRIDLKCGTVLLHSNKTQTVDTPHASILVKAGTVAVVTTSDEATQVFDLSDTRVGDVAVTIPGKAIYHLGPGKEVTIALGDCDPFDSMTADGIGRRNVHVEELTEENLVVVTNDFSILHALLKHPVFNQMQQSSAPEERNLLDKALKTAAALSLTVDRTRGAYTVQKHGH